MLDSGRYKTHGRADGANDPQRTTAAKRRKTSMSTWMVIACVWILFAVFVVLFVRGASADAHHIDDMHDDVVPARADASRLEI
jgi:hypothetical protein